MAIIATASGGSDFQLPPAGNHVARCYRIVDMGSHKNKFENVLRKILITWELHGEDDEGKPLCTDDGKPLVVSSNYTLSLSEKATLRGHLEAWRGRAFTLDELSGFNLENILNQYCMVSISHDNGTAGKTYANVKAISPIPTVIKKAGLPDGVNPIFIFSLDDFDASKFEKLSDGLKKKIMESPEYKKVTAVALSKPSKLADDGFPKSLKDLDNDIPF
jgi:hypothetical protein